MVKLKNILQRNPKFGMRHDPLDEILFEKCTHARMSYDCDIQFKVLDLQNGLQTRWVLMSTFCNVSTFSQMTLALAILHWPLPKESQEFPRRLQRPFVRAWNTTWVFFYKKCEGVLVPVLLKNVTAKIVPAQWYDTYFVVTVQEAAPFRRIPFSSGAPLEACT